MISIFRKKNKNNLYNSGPAKSSQDKERFYRKKWFIVTASVLAVLIVALGGFLYKTGYILNKISDSNDSTLGSLFGVIPGVGKEIEKEDDGRTNILLLGMRGENVPGGGLLADTVMVVSIKADENKVALISIPRDLYVKVPGTQSRAKINAVYAYGEEKGKREGLSQMKKIVSEVTGLGIHYSAAINFTGFTQIINAVGGIDINLDAAFYETNQFVKGNECGGQFYLPKGLNNLDGTNALCYVRARENTSDFDRAKRQQVVLRALKDKLVSLGTLTDFSKLNGILNSIGNNVRTDMSSSEMRKFFEEYASLNDAEVFQRVLENSEEGMLMVPQDAPKEAGYILIPRAGWDNYSQISEVCKNIYSITPQENIEPIKQKTKSLNSLADTKNSTSDSEKEKEEDIKVKVTGKLSLEDGLEIESTNLKIAKVTVKGPASVLAGISSVKIDLDDLSKVKKEGKIKISVDDLEIPKNTKITDPSDKNKTVLEIIVVKADEE